MLPFTDEVCAFEKLSREVTAVYLSECLILAPTYGPREITLEAILENGSNEVSFKKYVVKL